MANINVFSLIASLSWNGFIFGAWQLAIAQSILENSTAYVTLAMDASALGVSNSVW